MSKKWCYSFDDMGFSEFMAKKKQLLKQRSITLTDLEWEYVKQEAERNSVTAAQWVRKLIRLELASIGYFRGNILKKRS